MRLFYNKKTDKKVVTRLKNRVRIRRKLSGTGERPRLSVYRSTHHIYAQIIDDVTGKTLAEASTKKIGGTSNQKSAKAVGAEVAKLALSKNITSVVFDRSGYLYHGKIKAIADGAREAGLQF